MVFGIDILRDRNAPKKVLNILENGTSVGEVF